MLALLPARELSRDFPDRLALSEIDISPGLITGISEAWKRPRARACRGYLSRRPRGSLYTLASARDAAAVCSDARLLRVVVRAADRRPFSFFFSRGFRAMAAAAAVVSEDGLSLGIAASRDDASRSM